MWRTLTCRPFAVQPSTATRCPKGPRRVGFGSSARSGRVCRRLLLPTAGEAVKIFTGSALPEAGIGLVMVEDTLAEAGKVRVRVPATRRHVRMKGSHARQGDVLLPAGDVVNAGAVALLASVGAVEPLVSPEARVAHLVTGSELLSEDSKPPPGFIRDSNSPLVAALLAEVGAKRSFTVTSAKALRMP